MTMPSLQSRRIRSMATMTAEEIEQFVKEVVHHAPVLAGRAPLLKRLVVHLVANGFEVSTRFDSGASSVERTVGTESGHVRLDPTVGADCLWDLAHEVGHLDEPAERVDPVAQLRREEGAWDAGWIVLLNADATVAASRADYERRREECLDDYRAAAAVRRR